MIFSGIALPEWSVNDDEHVYHEDVTVNLRRTVLAVEQATVTVGLASIGNDDTVFLIAADTARIDTDPQSQELLLKVALALQGEHTGLNRFGYQGGRRRHHTGHGDFRHDSLEPRCFRCCQPDTGADRANVPDNCQPSGAGHTASGVRL